MYMAGDLQNMAGYMYIAQVGSIYFPLPLACENALPHPTYSQPWNTIYILCAFYMYYGSCGVLISDLLTPSNPPLV